MISYSEISKKSLQGYMLIFITQFISMIGSQIVSFGVIWYLTDISQSTLILSIASIVNIVPMILISPFAGVISDRVSKNFMLIITDAVQAGATLILIVFIKLGIADLWYIIALLGVRGLCQGFQMPVITTITSLMVPKKNIKTINSFEQILRSILSIASPALGAFFYSIWTLQRIYWLDVFTFLPTALILLLIRIPTVHEIQEVSNTPETQKRSFKQDFVEGMKYIKTSGLLSVFILFGIANFIVVPVFSLLPLLVSDFHQGDAIKYGLVSIMFQVGLLIGSLILMLSKRQPTMKSVVFYGALLSVVLLGMGLVPAGYWFLLYGVCFLLGVNLAFIDTQLISVLQLTIPKDLQGRVFSTMFTIIKSLNPLGLIIWGVIGEFTPVVWIFILSPVISLVIYGFIFKFTNILHYGESKPELLSNSEVMTEISE